MFCFPVSSFRRYILIYSADCSAKSIRYLPKTTFPSDIFPTSDRYFLLSFLIAVTQLERRDCYAAQRQSAVGGPFPVRSFW